MYNEFRKWLKFFTKFYLLTIPNDACTIFTSTNLTIRTKGRNLVLWSGPWTRRKVYIMKWTLDHPTTLFPPHMVPVQWSPSALHKFCFSNKLFRQRPQKHCSRFKYIPYLIFILSQTPQENYSLAFLSTLTWGKFCSTSVYVYLTWGPATWGWP